MNGKAKQSKFALRKSDANGGHSVVVTSAQKRYATICAGASLQPISSMRSPGFNLHAATSAADCEPDDQTKPNNGRIAEEMPMRSASPSGSANC